MKVDLTSIDQSSSASTKWAHIPRARAGCEPHRPRLFNNTLADAPLGFTTTVRYLAGDRPRSRLQLAAEEPSGSWREAAAATDGGMFLSGCDPPGSFLFVFSSPEITDCTAPLALGCERKLSVPNIRDRSFTRAGKKSPRRSVTYMCLDYHSRPPAGPTCESGWFLVWLAGAHVWRPITNRR